MRIDEFKYQGMVVLEEQLLATFVGKLWRHHRKLLSKLFRPSQLKSHIEAFQKAAEKLTASLSENVCRGSNFATMLNKALIQANHSKYLAL